MLHGAVRIVQELGKSRASAVTVRGYTLDDMIQPDTSVENSMAEAMKAEDETGDAEGRICLKSRFYSAPRLHVIASWEQSFVCIYTYCI